MSAKGNKVGIWMAKPKGRTVMGFAFGLGAAIVIIGALFKIMHWPFCNEMLIVGLGTEAVLFTLSSFQLTHAEPDWSIYYPYLVNIEDRATVAQEDDGTMRNLLTSPVAVNSGGSGGGSEATEKVAELMEKAKIDQALLDRLGNAMRDLSHNAEQLKSVSSAASATDSYVASLEEASKKMSSLSDAYQRASTSIAGLTSNTEAGESFGEQMQKVSKNLAALNNVYELQLQGSSAHLEATQGFQQQVVDMMSNLSASAEDTKLYRENMAMLAQNLTDLNNVYGNMLKAMRS
ncbi:MAG: gliding motility protein GldL [Flavobacteriia bacterium]|jgi:gliding motility-associated protein GldL|nr:gliding motility protein GldL [Flavobacteriia bacterium]